MKFLRVVGFPIFLLIGSLNAGAQSRNLSLRVDYSVNTPVGSFKDAISNTSWRGWNASLMYRINNKIAVGFETGFQDFYGRYPRALYKLSDGSDISAVVTNSVQTIPLLAKAEYYFSPGAKVQPYAAIGVGGDLVTFDQYLGEFANQKSSLAFAAKPELGIFVPFKKSGEAGVNFSASYNYMPFNYNGLTNLNNWAGGIGIKFPLR